MWNILCLMFTPKTACRSFHKTPSNDSSNFGYENQTAGICLGLCNIARNYIGPPEAHRYPTTFTVTLVIGYEPDVYIYRCLGASFICQ